MTTSDGAWPTLKEVVAEALELPDDRRADHLAERLPDSAQRAEAEALLEACGQAEAHPVLDRPAGAFAAPIVAQVREEARGVPEALRTALQGRYTIEGELGRGGMATVYLARDERHGRKVALKLLSPELMAEHGPIHGTARFQREIEFAARLSHPHILALHDSGAVGQLLYYITPYVDGESLRDRLQRCGRLATVEALRILRDVARALAHAHRQGVVHRDIKPANILLNQEGDALVADFGVAKGLAAAQGPEEPAEPDLTETSLLLGTPAYMAPEQIAGDSSVDHRADLYSFGAVAYELLTGAAPFAGRARQAQLAGHLSEAPEPIVPGQAEIPEELADLVSRLLAKRPSDRPGDADEVLQVLEAALEAPHPLRRRGGWGSWRRGRWRAVAAVLLAASAAIVWSASSMGDTPVGVPVDPQPSIAVLPFATRAGSLEDGVLGDGLSDGLFGALSRVSGLRVAGRVSAASLRQHDLDLRALGATLGVETVLRGSAQRDGDQLHVSVELVRAGDGLVLWSSTYDARSAELFGLQSRVAGDVTRAMTPAGLEAPIPTLGEERGTTDREAYELYLRGRRLTETRQRDALLRALGYFDEAVARDPGYARAYAAMADAWTFLGIFGHVSTHEAIPAARAAAERALAIDSLLVEARAVLAHALFVYEWHWQAAEAELERAIDLDPRYPLLRMYYASYLHSVGRPDEALAQLAVAADLDPLTPTGVFAGRIYVDTHRPEDAVRVLLTDIDLDPRRDLTYQLLGHAYLQLGRNDEAIESMRRASELSGARDEAQLAYVYAKTGDPEEARRILGGLLGGGRRLEPLGFHLAMAYGALGEPDAAFRWLEAAFAERASFMNLLGVASGFESLRSDPRFTDLLHRMGLG